MFLRFMFDTPAQINPTSPHLTVAQPKTRPQVSEELQASNRRIILPLTIIGCTDTPSPGDPSTYIRQDRIKGEFRSFTCFTVRVTTTFIYLMKPVADFSFERIQMEAVWCWA